MPWLTLLLPVVALHLWVLSQWPAAHWGLGAGARPAPIEVAFVRELAPAQARPVPPAEPPTRVLRAPRHAASAAGAPAALEADVAMAPLPPAAALPEMAPLAPSPAPLAAQLEEAPAPPSAAASASAQAAAFEWPPSTRLTYALTGNYRGPVEGQARVEWRLAGARYQVALEVVIGPPFAPIVTRQLLSEGLVTAAGLEPRRYEEETHIVLRPPRRLSIALDADQVRLPSGRVVPRPAGLQDSASQFVQMTWLFTLQPQRLRAGEVIELPLALPRQVQPWSYEVVGDAQVSTPIGAIDAVHVRPRRPQAAAGDLSAEFWVAPTLQNLPVRILIRQDEHSWVDLALKRLPQQADPPGR